MHHARPTLYSGVQMRSRLEASFAAHLDELGFSWEYEPICFASRKGQWLPDFKCVGVDILGERRTCYFEVKPHSASGEALAEVHNRAEASVAASEPTSAVALAIGIGWPTVRWIILMSESVIGGSGSDAVGGSLRWPSSLQITAPPVAASPPSPRRTLPPFEPATGRAVLGGRARRAVKEAFPGADLSDDIDLSMLVDDPSGPRKT
jgi:hypothetical protein